jgi:hypothetical protein
MNNIIKTSIDSLERLAVKSLVVAGKEFSEVVEQGGCFLDAINFLLYFLFGDFAVEIFINKPADAEIEETSGGVMFFQLLLLV